MRDSEQAKLAYLTRRRMLAAGAFGMSALAGCLGDGDGGDDDGTEDSGPSDDGDSEPPSEDVDQDLVLPTGTNPDEMYFAFQIGNYIDSPYNAPGDIYSATMEPGLWGRFFDSLYWPNEVPDVYPHLYEDVSIEPFEIEVTIRDDAMWSDGEPVRAKDAVANHAVWKEAPKWAPTPTETRFHIGALGRFEMPDGPDGKTYRFMPPDTQEWEDFGGFEPYGEGEVMARLGGTAGVFMMRGGPAFPTHLEPYEPLVDRAIEMWEEQPDDVEGTLLQVLTNELEWDQELHEWSRNPENIVSHGPWTVSEIRGSQEVVLEPNEHSRHVDDINFNRVIFEWSADTARTRGSIQAERLDYGQLTASPSEVESMPAIYEQELSPSSAGYAFGIDHNSFFGDRLVRQAFLYALDKEAIAGNIHPDTTRAVTKPGWDMWGTPDLFDESWAEENLIDYSQDLDKAESKMEEAGFERQDGVWHKDGEPFEYAVASSRDTPEMEETAISQLGNFGINLNLEVLDEGQYIERVRGSNQNEVIDEEYGGSGDYRIWSGQTAYVVSDGVAGFFDFLWHWWWWGVANARRTRRFNFFEHEKQEEALDQYAGNGWVRGNYPLWEDWTIDMPSEFGNPDSELEPFNPGYTWGEVRTGPKTFASEFEDNPLYNPPDGGSLEYYAKKYAWLHNWWLPVLPVAMNQNQHFLNTENWVWPRDHQMWEYFGLGWSDDELVGMNRIHGNPDSPK